MDDHTSLHLAGLGGSHWDRHYCPRQHAMQPTTRLGRAGFPACKLKPLGRFSHTGSCPTHTQTAICTRAMGRGCVTRGDTAELAARPHNNNKGNNNKAFAHCSPTEKGICSPTIQSSDFSVNAVNSFTARVRTGGEWIRMAGGPSTPRSLAEYTR